MKKSKFAAALVLSLIVLSGLYTPSSEAARADRRVRHQNARIRQGVRSGELTAGEAKELKADQRAIRKQKRENRSDGIVTKEERQELRGMQNDASKDIHNLKHNDIEAPRAE